MTGTSDRIRATLLALVVVVSVAAAPIAFGGTTTAQTNNLTISGTQTVFAGNGSVTITMDVASGADASFIVEDNAGTVSNTVTVTDDGSGDAMSGTAGTVKLTLDLSSMFSSSPASGRAYIHAAEGTSVTVTGATETQEFYVDADVPTVDVGGSSTITTKSGAQIDIPYDLHDKPSSSSVSGTMKLVDSGGNVVYQFSESIQVGSSRMAQTTLPSDMPEGTYDVRFIATDAVGHTSSDTWTDGLTVSSSSSATATSATVVSTQPVKGTGTVTVSANLATTTGNNITFAVEDGAGVVSASKTVQDGGPRDLSGTAGTVETTLDLDALFGSTDVTSSSQARLLVAGGDSISVNSFDDKVQFALDASPPTLKVLGSGSNNKERPVYTQSGKVSTGEEAGSVAQPTIGWNWTDVPQKYQNYTLTVSRHGSVLATANSSALSPPIGASQAKVKVPDTWAEGKYNVSVTIHDEVGYSASDTFTGGLVVDETPPAVREAWLWTSASADEGGKKIRLEFASGPINSESIGADTFDVYVNESNIPSGMTQKNFTVTSTNVTTDGDVTIAVGAAENTNLAETWSVQSPTVYLNGTSYIADLAGNRITTRQVLAANISSSGTPQNPDEIYVPAEPISGDEIQSVEVSVNFTSPTPDNDTLGPQPDPPEKGTIYLQFTGPSGNTVVKTMPTDTSSSLTTGHFDLSSAGLRDGDVQVEAKLVDDEGTTNPDGYTALEVSNMAFPPAVSSMQVSNAPIDAAEAKSSQTVTVTFNEQMNTSVTPTVAVTGVGSSAIPVTESSYSNDTWTGTVDLPQNVSTTATLEVRNATGSGGATLADTATMSFRIDTVRPADPASVTITDSNVTASEMSAVGVNATWDHDVGGQSVSFRFTDGTQTVTRTVDLSSPGVTVVTNSTVVSTAVNLTNTGLNGSVTASAKATDGVGNANPSGFTATSTSVEFQADGSGGGGGSGGGSGGDGGSGSLPAPSSVAVPDSPIDAAESNAVSVEVTFASAPSSGNVAVTFADDSTTLTHTVAANTNSTTTTATVDISTKNFTDGTLDVSARLVDGSNESASTSTTAVLDTSGPTFSNERPAPGATAALGLDAISVDVTDAGVGVNASTLQVSIEDGDSDSTWDVNHSTTSSAQVSYANGTLTYVPTASFEGGNVTVHVTATDEMGHVAETEWNFSARSIEGVSIDAVEHDFVGVVQEPDSAVTVTASATSSGGATIQSTSGGTFTMTLTRNGSQVTGTQSVTANASNGEIAFDLTKAITGTPEAGPVTVRVASSSGDAAGTATVNLTHKVVAFDSKWELMGTPMPVAELHTSGVANFYSYSPDTGYESGIDVTKPGVGYYAEKVAGASTARVGYTFETVSRTTFGNQTLEPGWNLVGASFDVDAQNSVAVSNDLQPTDFADVVVYTEQRGDLKLVNSGSATVGEFDGYFVFVENETTRAFAVETYQPAQDQQSTA